MSVANDVSQAKDWCNTARHILSKKVIGTSDNKRMRVADKELNSRLTKYKGKLPDPVHQGFETNYLKLAGEAHDVEGSGLTKKKKQEALKTIADKMVTLSKDLATLGNSFEAFTKARSDAVEKQRELATLKRGTHTYDDELKRLLSEADQEAGQSPPKYDQALEKLKGVKQDYTVKKKKAETDIANELEQTRHQPVYEDKRQRIQTAIAELQALPGTKPQVTKLEALLAAGDDELTSGSGDYEKAYKKLSGLTKLLKEGREASPKFENSAGGQKFQAARKTAAAKLEEYDQVAGAFDSQGLAGFRRRYDALLKQLDPPPVQNVVDQATRDMETLRDELVAKVTNVLDQKRNCDPLLQAAREVGEKLRACAPLDVYEPLLAKEREARAAYSAQNYVRAAALCNEIKVDGDKELQTYSPLYDEWIKLRDKVDKDYLPSFLEASSLGLALGDYALTLKDYAMVKETVVQTREFGKAIACAQEVETVVTKFVRPTLQDFAKLQDARTEGTKAIEAAWERATTKVEQLERAGGDSESFQDPSVSADGARTRWRVGQLKTVDPGTLTDLRDSCLKSIQNLVDKIDVILKNQSGELDDSKRLATKNKRPKELAEVLQRLQKAFDRLASEYPSEAASFASRIESLKTVTAPTAQDIRLAQVLEEVVEKKLAEKQTELQTVVTKVEGAANKCQESAKKLRGKFKDFKGLCEAIDIELKDYLAMANSSVRSVVEAAVPLLETLTSKIDGWLKSNSALEQVHTALQTLEKTLGEKVVAERFPGRSKSLQTRLKEGIKPDCHRLDPALAWKSVVQPFQTEVDELRAAAQKADLILEEIATKVQTLRDSLKGKLADSPKLKASFEARIAALSKPGENGEQKALLDLQALGGLITKCLAGTPEAEGLCGTLEQQATEQEFKAQKAEAEWKAAVDVFEKNSLRSAKSLFDELSRTERNSALFRDIESAFKAAKKLADNGSFTEANVQLTEARRAAERFLANPLDPATTARVALSKVNARWKQTVARFIGQLNRLAGIIREELTQEAIQKPDIDKKLKAILDLSLLLDADQFDEQVGVLQKTLPVKAPELLKALSERRLAKEDALRNLRRFRTAVEKNPILKHLEDNNPFVQPAEADFSSGLLDSMNEWEFNLQRA